ncbi:MAG TPA: tellurite-like stress resistance cysteine protease StiP [Fibrobacteria bacterium]|nr:tellurite-like stress resistance cysteine protease StiP [Fibrobacteria bacterium]HOX51099.1 tellurite-like stress resistance cysteine protease StiP [Fibrobacteria bacterium]
MPERWFSGSYRPEDCRFLLKVVDLAPVSVEEKERLIQSGARHYSQMISAESPPTERYQRLFLEAVEREGARLAAHLLLLARDMDERICGRIVVVSLARAGTPMGVILRRILTKRFGRDCAHFSVSIVRDRGIDRNALSHILECGYPAESIVFVDGWTGKGTIARELAASVESFNAEHGTAVGTGVWTVADLSGSAEVAASAEDFLIPSSLLNSTVSGLVSRTILHEDHSGPGEFHGCLRLDALAPFDRSGWFVDRIEEESVRIPLEGLPQPLRSGSPRSRLLREAMESMLDDLARRFPSARNRNFAKPGLGESTRVLLRRIPERLLLSESDHPEAEHLRLLAREKDVPVEVIPGLPVKAVALIRGLD